MGYRDVMSTSAPPADPRSEDSIELHRLVEEQAALRRVATLVASGAPSAEVFSAVAREVAQVMHLPMVARLSLRQRRPDDGHRDVRATVRTCFQPGTRWPLDGQSMVAAGAAARAARLGSRTTQTFPARSPPELVNPGSTRLPAPRSSSTAPSGEPSATSSPDAPLPDHLEDRLAEFTELVATAIANSEAHEQLARLADEQAALRRVATLVARARHRQRCSKP